MLLHDRGIISLYRIRLADRIYAIVSRGGRPDLSGSESLKNVKAATLFIVGEKNDKDIISLNKKAFKQLKNTKNKDFTVIPKAGHLFDEEAGFNRENH